MRELPTGNRLKLLIRAFEEVNAGIPLRLLKPAYWASMRLRNEEGFPGYWDARTILAAYEQGDWSRFGPEQTLSKVSRSTGADCSMCFGAGMRKKVHPIDPTRSGMVVCDHVPELADQEASSGSVRGR
jgi:hypothetical protein